MGQVISFPKKKKEKELSVREIQEIVYEANNMIESYLVYRERVEEERKKRRAYLQELDEFEELIHGKHPKLVD